MAEWVTEKADLSIAYSNKKVKAFTTLILKAFLVFVPCANFYHGQIQIRVVSYGEFGDMYECRNKS